MMTKGRAWTSIGGAEGVVFMRIKHASAEKAWDYLRGYNPTRSISELGGIEEVIQLHAHQGKTTGKGN